MKAASLKELKVELQTLPPAQLIDLCMHLAKYKKENKELLTYLLFEADDERSYIESVKALIDEQFQAINHSNVYLIKKSLRKVIRITNKYIKYSGSKETETELLLYVCRQCKINRVFSKHSTALENIYLRLIQRIRKAISTLHEDLQYDYNKELEML